MDVHCSSLNDSFTNSFTVKLPSNIDTVIAVQVPVHGTGVHLGYVYVIQATLLTTDGSKIESDPITAGMCICVHTTMNVCMYHIVRFTYKCYYPL